MIFEIFLKVVGVVVDVVAILVALVVNVSNHQKAMEILGWSDDVKDWLRKHKIDPLNILLTVAGFTGACFGDNIIWSAWHVKSPMYTTVGEKIGFSMAGGFVYLAGLALYLISLRKYFRKRAQGA